MRPELLAASLAFATVLMAWSPPAAAQAAATAPAFVVGDDALYCHVTQDDLVVWMNALQDDGAGVPFYLTGASAFTDPVAGVGMDPVVNEDFETRIPLMPAAGQSFVLDGTVKVQEFIGSGAYGGGVADIGNALAIDGKVVGSAAAEQHQMTPKNGNVPGGTGPYDELDQSFAVANVEVPAGALVEWVISGHITVVNNMFLACHEARGRSNIVLPVVSLGPGGGTAGNGTGNATGNATGNSTTSVPGNATASPSTSASATNSSTGPANVTKSDNSTAAPSKGAPAPSLPVAAGAVLVVAAAMRRRRR